MNRGAGKKSILPADKIKEKGTKEVPSQPMPDNKVKVDWKGETRDTLWSKADMPPSD